MSFDELMMKLKELEELDFIPIDEIPDLLKKDFDQFIVGQTLNTIDGKSCISRRLFYVWLEKVYAQEWMF